MWSLDSNGNYLSNLTAPIAGNSSTLESFETIFGQDLNGDGHIGAPPPPPPTVIQTDGTTALTEVGTNYFLNPTGGGTGPELKFGGSAIIAGQFGSSVTPIGAVQVSGGDYDIAWHDTSSGLYSVWSVDSNGNYLSNLATSVAGNSSTLESFETIFGQDFNGDGTIGIPAASHGVATNVTANNGSAITNSVVNLSSDNFQFSSGAGGETPVSPNTQNSAIATATHDSFVFAHDHGNAGTAGSTSWADAVPPGDSAPAYAHTAPAETHEDAFVASIMPDAAHAAQWLAHHNGFHFV